MEERVPVITEGTTFAIHPKTRRKQQWYIGAFIAFNGIEETYKAALYNGITPTDYPAVLKIVPHGDEPPPADFQFYLKNTDPTDRWVKVKKFKYVSLPVLLGIGNAEIKGTDYQFIIMTRYEKDVWSLFLENGRKLNEHTVYKVGLRLLSTIHYIHSQAWIHNDIRGSNIMVDASEKHIYLVNYHSASQYETGDEQIDSNGANNVPVEYMSRDAHMGVSTMRGDIESLFYNLVQWLGVKLPWEKNLENVSLVKQQKNSAFTNVERFLSKCFKRREVPDPIRKFMNCIANIDPQSKPEYRHLKRVLCNGILKLHHVPEGDLSFPLDNGSDDETMEGFSDVKQNKLRRGQKSKLEVSVDQLAKIASKNFKSKDEVDLQGEVVSDSLIHAGWHAPAAVSNNVLNHSTPSCSFSRAGTMDQNRTSLLDVPPPIDTIILPANGARATSSRSNGVQSPAFQNSTSGYSSRSSSRVGILSEDLSLFRTPDPFLEKEPCQAGTNVEAVVERWRSESVTGFESWHDNYELLDTWLDMKEKDLRAFISIPSESGIVISLMRQVRVLLDDFRSRNSWIRQLMNVLANLPPDSADAQKFKRIQHRWHEQLDWLEKRGRELGKASLGQLRNTLQNMSSSLDKLLLDSDPEEQLLRNIETFAGQLEGQETLLASAGAVTEQLCQAFNDATKATFNAKFRAEFQSINDLYDDLQHRINVKKGEIERSLNDDRQFDDSCKRMIVWLGKELDMSDKLVISADPEKLQQQHQHYQSVMDKETEVNELLNKGRDFLSRSQNLENKTQQGLLDLMKSQWDRLKKNSLQFSNRLQTCIRHHDNYCKVRKLLLSWLNNIEHKLDSLQPATFDDVEKVLTELSSLDTETRDESKKFEQCTNLGKILVNACDGDKDLVENELMNMKDRWEKLKNNVRERTEFFSDTSDRFAVFNERMNDLQQRLDGLKSRDNLREESGDPSLIDYMKELQDETALLCGSRLKEVRKLADELVSIVGDQGLDTNSLLETVRRVDDDIKNFKLKLAEDLNKAYEEKDASIENDIKPKVNVEQDVKPKISQSTTNRLPIEIVSLVSDSDSEADLESPRIRRKSD